MEREGRPALSLLIRLQQMRCKLSVCELGLRRVPQNENLKCTRPRHAASWFACSSCHMRLHACTILLLLLLVLVVFCFFSVFDPRGSASLLWAWPPSSLARCVFSTQLLDNNKAARSPSPCPRQLSLLVTEKMFGYLICRTGGKHAQLIFRTNSLTDHFLG